MILCDNKEFEQNIIAYIANLVNLLCKSSNILSDIYRHLTLRLYGETIIGQAAQLSSLRSSKPDCLRLLRSGRVE